MKKSIYISLVILHTLTIAGIGFVAYLTHMNKARIQATQRVMVETDARLESTYIVMDQMKQGQDEREEAARPLPKGSPAPDFALTNDTNEEVSLASFRGSKTLLVFSQPGCGYCEKFYPALKEYTTQETAVNVVVLQLNSSAEENQSFKAERGLDVPFLSATSEQLRAYKVKGTPTSVLLDEEGKVLGSENIITLDDLNAFVANAGTVAIAE